MSRIVQDLPAEQQSSVQRGLSLEVLGSRGEAFQNALADALAKGGRALEAQRPAQPEVGRRSGQGSQWGENHNALMNVVPPRSDDSIASGERTARREDDGSLQGRRVRFEGDMAARTTAPQPRGHDAFIAAMSAANLDGFSAARRGLAEEPVGQNSVQGGSDHAGERGPLRSDRPAPPIDQGSPTELPYWERHADGARPPLHQRQSLDPALMAPSDPSDPFHRDRDRSDNADPRANRAPHIPLQDLTWPLQSLERSAERRLDRASDMRPTIRFARAGETPFPTTARTSSTVTADPSASNVTVNIVRQAVHLPPVRSNRLITETLERPMANKSSGASLDLVLAQFRTALMADGVNEPSATQLDQSGGRQLASSAAANHQLVKVVELMLQPASLGLLTVTLRLTASGLRVGVNATERDTVQLLAENESQLASLLYEAGYDVDGLDISFKTSNPRIGPRPTPLFGGRTSSVGIR